MLIYQNVEGVHGQRKFGKPCTRLTVTPHRKKCCINAASWSRGFGESPLQICFGDDHGAGVQVPSEISDLLLFILSVIFVLRVKE